MPHLCEALSLLAQRLALLALAPLTPHLSESLSLLAQRLALLALQGILQLLLHLTPLLTLLQPADEGGGRGISGSPADLDLIIPMIDQD